MPNMRLYFSLLLFAIFHFSCASFQSKPKNETVILDKSEARKAFEFLNLIRKNPGEFSERIGTDLNKITSSPSLVWNDILAKVAEEKAHDMASRNYFAHVNPEKKGINFLIHSAGYKLIKDFRKSKRDNNFESIQAGARNGEAAIIDLILDEGIPGKGHRNHLLAMGKWNKGLKDIGIGFVKSENSKYRTYTCIIIAKQDW